MNTNHSPTPRADSVAPEQPPARPVDTRIPPAGAAAPPKRRRGRRWAMVIACLLGLLAVPVVGYFYMSWTTERDLVAAIEEIDRLDPRWRFKDLMADRAPIPDADNPALVVAKIDAMLMPGNLNLSEKDGRLFDDLSSVHRLNGPQIAALRELLNRNPEAVKLARTLKDFPGEGRFVIRLGPNFISTSVEPLQRCRGIMGLLQHDAMLRAEEDDAAGALESSQALLVAARAIGDEPFLIAALIRFAGEAVAVAALERTLAQGEPPAEQLKAMQALLAKEIDAPFFAQAMRGERGGFDAMIGEMQQGSVRLSSLMGGPGGGRGLEDRLLDAFPGIMLSGRGDYLRLMTKAVEAAKLPAEEQANAFDEVEDAMRSSKTFVVRMLMPAVAKVSQANIRSRAQLRCALVGVAAERYRIQHEAWPNSIEELVQAGLLAAVPVDTMNGEPLRYKLMPDGVIVYSVGLDGVDNGGLLNANLHLAGFDLGFRLWNAELRRQAPLPPMPPPPDNGGGPP